jgi:acyl-coenzyme A thioesterase PaaI-like protein
VYVAASSRLSRTFRIIRWIIKWTFWSASIGFDVIVTARVTKLGRTLAFLSTDMTTDGATQPAAQATTVYAILS